MTRALLIRSSIVVTLLIGLGCACARAQPAEHEHFGEAQFPMSCSATAQRQFDRALAMLHSFLGPVDAFHDIVVAEPDCAIAYWGIAISQRPNPLAPPFPAANLSAGWEAIEKGRAAKQKTQRESDWIEALAPFFQDYATVDQPIRTLNYAAAMGRLHNRYPDDTEAAVLYALALNEAADLNDTSYANQLRAGAILEDLWPRHPNHPGIPHLGELLLEANDPASALQEFSASLRSLPNRYRSFAGAAKAAERLGDLPQAKDYYEQLATLCRGADVDIDRPDLSVARQFPGIR
jgi:tetratricopeptide (TPR) repeat protein